MPVFFFMASLGFQGGLMVLVAASSLMKTYPKFARPVGKRGRGPPLQLKRLWLARRLNTTVMALPPRPFLSRRIRSRVSVGTISATGGQTQGWRSQVGQTWWWEPSVLKTMGWESRVIDRRDGGESRGGQQRADVAERQGVPSSVTRCRTRVRFQARQGGEPAAPQVVPYDVHGRPMAHKQHRLATVVSLCSFSDPFACRHRFICRLPRC